MQLADVSAALECLDEAIGGNREWEEQDPVTSEGGAGAAVIVPVVKPAVVTVGFTPPPCTPPQVVNIVGFTPPPCTPPQVVNIGPITSDVTPTGLSPSPTAVDTTPTQVAPMDIGGVVMSPIPTTPGVPSIDGCVVASTSPTTPLAGPNSTASTPSPTCTPTQTPSHRSADTQFVMMEIQELEEEPVGGARVHSGEALWVIRFTSTV